MKIRMGVRFVNWSRKKSGNVNEETITSMLSLLSLIIARSRSVHNELVK